MKQSSLDARSKDQSDDSLSLWKSRRGNRGPGTANSATVPTQSLDIKTALRLARNL